ncbi:MAG: hypothetical protein ABWY63_03200, partial [Hyphomicrobiaceae bacterium]
MRRPRPRPPSPPREPDRAADLDPGLQVAAPARQGHKDGLAVHREQRLPEVAVVAGLDVAGDLDHGDDRTVDLTARHADSDAFASDGSFGAVGLRVWRGGWRGGMGRPRRRNQRRAKPRR